MRHVDGWLLQPPTRLRLGDQKVFPNRRRRERCKNLRPVCEERPGERWIERAAAPSLGEFDGSRWTSDGRVHSQLKSEVQQARRPGNRITAQLVRIALAIPALVHLAKCLDDRRAHLQFPGELHREIAMRHGELLRSLRIGEEPRDRRGAPRESGSLRLSRDRQLQAFMRLRRVSGRECAEEREIVAGTVPPCGLVRERRTANEPQERRVVDVGEVSRVESRRAPDAGGDEAHTQRGLVPEARRQIRGERESADQFCERRPLHTLPAFARLQYRSPVSY